MHTEKVALAILYLIFGTIFGGLFAIGALALLLTAN